MEKWEQTTVNFQGEREINADLILLPSKSCGDG